MRSCSLRCFNNGQDVTKHVYSSSVHIHYFQFQFQCSMYILLIILTYFDLKTSRTFCSGVTFTVWSRCSLSYRTQILPTPLTMEL